MCFLSKNVHVFNAINIFATSQLVPMAVWITYRRLVDIEVVAGL